MKRECFALLVLAALAGCGGQAAVYEYLGSGQATPAGGADNGGADTIVVTAGASSLAAGGAATDASGGANAEHAGETGAGGSGASTAVAGGGSGGGSAAASGASGDGGASSAGGASGAGGGQVACLVAADCPRPQGGCKAAHCTAGVCSIAAATDDLVNGFVARAAKR